MNSKFNIQNSKLGLYVHIPFCLSKCPYCDFSSFTGIENLADDYIECIHKELKYYKDKYDTQFKTLFIGGGTPTCLSDKQLENLFAGIYKLNSKEEFSEITIEANPETITKDKAKIIFDNVNRVSLGVQSFDNAFLKRLDRIHSSDKVFKAVEMLHKAGINNLNIDIMFGIPGQNKENVLSDIEQAIAIGSTHISFYMMTVYEETPAFAKAMAGKPDFIMPDEPLIENMYLRGIEKLESKGFEQYEISNFAKEKKHSEHNINYWETGIYAGLGSSAASYFDGYRYTNIKEPEKYIDMINKGKDPADFSEKPDKETLIKEYIMLRLRTSKGLVIKEFIERFDFDFTLKYSKIIRKYVLSKLMENDENRIFLTKKGFLLSNTVISEFF